MKIEPEEWKYLKFHNLSEKLGFYSDTWVRITKIQFRFNQSNTTEEYCWFSGKHHLHRNLSWYKKCSWKISILSIKSINFLSLYNKLPQISWIKTTHVLPHSCCGSEFSRVRRASAPGPTSCIKVSAGTGCPLRKSRGCWQNSFSCTCTAHQGSSAKAAGVGNSLL